MTIRAIFTGALTLIVCMVPHARAEWPGEEAVKDGVLHVTNPETAVEEVRVELEELWRRGGEEDDIIFGVVSQLVHDKEGNTYVLDSQLSEIHVFSPSGEHLRTIGREGEGPGEFRNVSDMYLGPGGLLGIVRVFPGRVFRLGLDGSPADHFPLPEDSGGGFQLLFVGRATSDRIVLSGATQTSRAGKQVQISHLKAYDKDGNELAHFYDESQETRFGGMKFDEKTFSNFSYRWALAPDGRVAAALEFDAYRVHIWKPDGTLDRIIERPDHGLLDRTGEQKERFQKLYDGITRWSPSSTFKVSDTHVAVSRLWFRPDGSLWVLSGRSSWAAGDDEFAGVDEYDRDGRFVRRIHLVVDGDPVEDGIFFSGDRMFLVTDLFSAMMSVLGGDSAESDEDTEPLQLIACRFEMPEIGSR